VSAAYSPSAAAHRLAADSAASAFAHAAVEPRLSAALGDPARPTFPPKWTAQTTVISSVNGVVQTPFVPGLDTSVVINDDDAQRRAQVTRTFFPFAPLEFEGTPLSWLNMTQYLTADYWGMEMNGETLDGSIYPQVFHSQFSWMQAARYAGSATLNGTAADVWSLGSPGANLTLMVTRSGLPLFEHISSVYPGVGIYETNTTFSGFTAGADDSVWDGYDAAVFKKPPVCPLPADGLPAPLNKTFYIFHPKANFNITMQDLGDAQGDVLFVCSDVLTNQSTSVDSHYQWISAWSVELVPRWGQYQNCNGYPPKCLGAENFWVGHEAPDALGLPMGGQCISNAKVGEWYSLPAGGKCVGAARPGDGSCTWRATRVKTIDSHCLFEEVSPSFKSACSAEQRAPFEKATVVFEQAFASGDVARGGCPALAVEPAHEMRGAVA